MADALEQVKRHFGRDAVILNTRTGTRGGFLGIGGNSYVEITAVHHASDLPAPLRRGTVSMRSRQGGCADGSATRMSPSRTPVANQLSDAILSEMGAVKAMVRDLMCETRRTRAADLPGVLFETYQSLVQNEVAEQVSQQLIAELRTRLTERELRDPQAVRVQLASGLEKMLPTAGPIRIGAGPRPRVIALVGPTGVGKTTTIAKLAANFCLRDRRRVGLVTIDTYRIAAVEQLRTYAQIIDVPLEVALSPKEFKNAVVQMADRDIVLVDTAGRSQRDVLKVQELQTFFTALRPDEVHLVLSSTSGEAVLSETIERFRTLGIDRVIFTKLDEAIGFGVILTCLQKAEATLSYVTTGQDVPEDIRIGEGKALAELILGKRRRQVQEPLGGTRSTLRRQTGGGEGRSGE